MNDEVSELLKKAEQGDADAELRLGSAYCSGQRLTGARVPQGAWNRFTRHLIRAVKAGHRMRTAKSCLHPEFSSSFYWQLSFRLQVR